MSEDLIQANTWFSRLPLNYKALLFDIDIVSFNDFNGYEECANFIYNRWVTLGLSVKIKLYKYFING